MIRWLFQAVNIAIAFLYSLAMPSSIGRVSIVLPLNQFVHADEFDLLAIAAVGAADTSQ